MKICRFDPKNFKGVFSCDNFHQKVKEKCIIPTPGDQYIINLSSSNHRGSHWVAIHINSHQEADYFDSYGLDCYDNFIKTAFEELRIAFMSFNKIIQDPSLWTSVKFESWKITSHIFFAMPGFETEF